MIKTIGRYLPQKENGVLLNDCTWEKVPTHWHPLIETVKKNYLLKADKAIHSIYLRGSVPAGIAVDGLADLDTFAIVKKEKIHWEELTWGKSLEEDLSSVYPFACGIEVVYSGINEAGELYNPFLRPILKLQSICIWGENLGPGLPDYHPGRELMRNYRWIKEDVAALAKGEQQSAAEIKSLLKTIIRTGFDLVMEREQKFTTDLYPCWKSFSKYYPQWEEEMKKALLYFLDLPTDKTKLQLLTNGLGAFLIKEVDDRMLRMVDDRT